MIREVARLRGRNAAKGHRRGVQAMGHRISHEGVACVLRAAGGVEAREISAILGMSECEVRRWLSPRTKLKLTLPRLRRRGQ